MFLVGLGLENAMVARRPSRGAVLVLVAVDALFAVAVVALAIADPTGAETWTRWSMVAVADLAAGFGVAKLVGLTRGADTSREALPVS